MNTNTKNNTTHYGNPNTNTRNNTTYYGNTNANTSNNTAQHGTMLEPPWGCSTVLVRTDKKRNCDKNHILKRFRTKVMMIFTGTVESLIQSLIKFLANY